MSKHKPSEQQDGFAFDEPQAASEPTIVGDLPHSDREEVPQARFLGWPEQSRLLYCMERDLDSAEHETSLEWCQFYLDRAESYRLQLAALLAAPLGQK